MAYLPFIAACVGLLVVLSIVWTTLRVGISPMPSSRLAKKAVVELIPENTPGPIIDLGSGWGSLTRAVAGARPGLSVTGFELSLIPWLWAWTTAKIGRREIHYLRRNFFEEDLTSARIVLCYLYPEAMTRISETPDLLAPETVVITNTFRIPGWEPETVVELDDLYRTRVYRYIVGDSLTNRAE